MKPMTRTWLLSRIGSGHGICAVVSLWYSKTKGQGKRWPGIQNKWQQLQHTRLIQLLGNSINMSQRCYCISETWRPQRFWVAPWCTIKNDKTLGINLHLIASKAQPNSRDVKLWIVHPGIGKLQQICLLSWLASTMIKKNQGTWLAQMVEWARGSWSRGSELEPHPCWV